MKIELKEKWMCFVVSNIATKPLNQYFNLVNQIKINSQCKSEEDVVSVSISPIELFDVYQMVGDKPNYLVATINKNIKESLVEQLTQKFTNYMKLLNGKESFSAEELSELSSDDLMIVIEADEVQDLYKMIGESDFNSDVELEQMINFGRNIIK